MKTAAEYLDLALQFDLLATFEENPTLKAGSSIGKDRLGLTKNFELNAAPKLSPASAKETAPARGYLLRPAFHRTPWAKGKASSPQQRDPGSDCSTACFDLASGLFRQYPAG
jgi:hypothetical protein